MRATRFGCCESRPGSHSSRSSRSRWASARRRPSTAWSTRCCCSRFRSRTRIGSRASSRTSHRCSRASTRAARLHLSGVSRLARTQRDALRRHRRDGHGATNGADGRGRGGAVGRQRCRANTFALLRRARLFWDGPSTPGDDANPNVVVLSFDTWHRHFHADPDCRRHTRRIPDRRAVRARFRRGC